MHNCARKHTRTRNAGVVLDSDDEYALGGGGQGVGDGEREAEWDDERGSEWAEAHMQVCVLACVCVCVSAKSVCVRERECVGRWAPRGLSFAHTSHLSFAHCLFFFFKKKMPLAPFVFQKQNCECLLRVQGIKAVESQGHILSHVYSAHVSRRSCAHHVPING